MSLNRDKVSLNKLMRYRKTASCVNFTDHLYGSGHHGIPRKFITIICVHELLPA